MHLLCPHCRDHVKVVISSETGRRQPTCPNCGIVDPVLVNASPRSTIGEREPWGLTVADRLCQDVIGVATGRGIPVEIAESVADRLKAAHPELHIDVSPVASLDAPRAIVRLRYRGDHALICDEADDVVVIAGEFWHRMQQRYHQPEPSQLAMFGGGPVDGGVCPAGASAPAGHTPPVSAYCGPRLGETRYDEYPTDRQSLWPGGASHPAKMSIPIVRDLAEQWLTPTSAVLDPFGGAGTTALVTLRQPGRRATIVELEARWADCAAANARRLRDRFGDHLGVIEVVNADSVRWLAEATPEQFDLVLTSPPFWGDTGRPGRSGDIRHYLNRTGAAVSRSTQNQGRGYDGDASNPANIGNTADADHYRAALSAIWAGCARVLKPGGVLIAVVGDAVRAKQPVYVHDWIGEDLQSVGFAPAGHHLRRKRPGALRNLQAQKARNRGEDDYPLIDYEVIIVMQRSNYANR